MAELTIRPDEIRDALNEFVQKYEPTQSAREEVGSVITSGDGIARVDGLPSAMANELLRFGNGTLGIALNLEARVIGGGGGTSSPTWPAGAGHSAAIWVIS